MDIPETSKLAYQLSQVRNEVNNIRKTLHCERAQYKDDVQRLEELINTFKFAQLNEETSKDKIKKTNYGEITEIQQCENFIDISKKELLHMKPIGYIKSLHHHKNGTPRQGIISNLSRGQLKIEKDVYNNPSHSLEGLKKYSHIWILYIFHENTSDGSHAKVSPPRLDGCKVGIFSTRSPHRPNPVGMTLAKLDGVEDDMLLVSGIDILDGSPVIDIKPYIPQYDSPFSPKSISDEKAGNSCDLNSKTLNRVNESTKLDNENDNKNKLELKNLSPTKGMAAGNTLHSVDEDDIVITVPEWINSPTTSGLKVIFNPIAEHQINLFSNSADDPSFRLEYLKSSKELRTAISSILSEDPRSTYRRHKCSDRLYFFMVDSAHITTCFFGDMVEVLRVCPPDRDNPYYRLI